MTVKELKELLKGLPDDMPVLTTLYSDYVELPPPTVREFFPANGRSGRWEEFHPMQWEHTAEECKHKPEWHEKACVSSFGRAGARSKPPRNRFKALHFEG